MFGELFSWSFTFCIILMKVLITKKKDKEPVQAHIKLTKHALILSAVFSQPANLQNHLMNKLSTIHLSFGQMIEDK